jgi:hydroxymethylglutaryl-CoA reductase
LFFEKAKFVMNRCSRISNFYKKSCDERLEVLKNFADLSYSEIDLLKKSRESNFFVELMSENVVSAFALPYSIATNFLINGFDYLIPMVTEETSIVAAASNAAKLCRESGGFTATADKSLMIGQIHLINIKNIQVAKSAIEMHKSELLGFANKCDPTLVGLGGGAVDIVVREMSTSFGTVLAVHLIVDVRDAMGANAVNTMIEKIAPEIEKIITAKTLMQIISNLSIYKIARAKAVWGVQMLGTELIKKIIQAGEVARVDIFRAVTHNKGIMNGIDAVAIATGNDFRALEAGAHGFAALNNSYKPLTYYQCDDSGNLVGEIELPLAVGVVGGAINVNPLAKISQKILGVKSASELAQIMACVGLAQNFAAIKAIVDGGIQAGHMRLHKEMLNKIKY